MSRKEKSYSAELKYQAVSDYLSGKGSLREICRKYKIRSTRQLRNWIKMYNGHKELKCYTGGSRMTKGRKTTYGHTFTSREQLISTIESYIDYYNNRRYQHRLFIQTPMQAHVCAMNRSAWPTNCTKNSPFLCRNGEWNPILFLLSTWRSASHFSEKRNGLILLIFSGTPAGSCQNVPWMPG